MKEIRVPLKESVGASDMFGVRRRAPRRRVTQVIVSELMADIASGKIALGQRLPSQRDLAVQFGVSQPTVREAISALTAMGLVEVRHGSGAYIVNNVQDFVTSMLTTLVQMESVSVFEVLDVRQVLGVYSVERAASYATDKDVATMAAFADACENAVDIPSTIDAIVSFQTACSAAARNPLLFALESFLIKVLMHLQLVGEGDRGVGFWADQTSRFTPHRRSLLDRIADGDKEGAVLAMKVYLAAQREWFSSDAEMSSITLANPLWMRLMEEMSSDGV